MINNYISVVIPCYNSQKTIKDVVDVLIDTLGKRDTTYEVILVNDGSKDNTWEEILKLSKGYKEVKGINFTRNFGQHAATMAGFRESKGDIVVTLDDDGQTNPQDLWKLVDKLDEGYDVVLAKYPKAKESLFRRFGSNVNRIMAESLIEKPKEIRGSSFRVIKRYIIDDMIKYDKSYPYIGGLIYRSTQNIGQVEIEHKERKVGKSGYTFKKLVKLVINGFTSFSIKPLRIASYTGFVTAFIGFIYGIIIIIKKIIKPTIQLGYSSIMATLLFIGGSLMIMVGLIGEYIGRIYISINNSPQYVIKEKTN